MRFHPIQSLWGPFYITLLCILVGCGGGSANKNGDQADVNQAVQSGSDRGFNGDFTLDEVIATPLGEILYRAVFSPKISISQNGDEVTVQTEDETFVGTIGENANEARFHKTYAIGDDRQCQILAGVGETLLDGIKFDCTFLVKTSTGAGVNYKGEVFYTASRIRNSGSSEFAGAYSRLSLKDTPLEGSDANFSGDCEAAFGTTLVVESLGQNRETIDLSMRFGTEGFSTLQLTMQRFAAFREGLGNYFGGPAGFSSFTCQYEPVYDGGVVWKFNCQIGSNSNRLRHCELVYKK